MHIFIFILQNEDIYPGSETERDSEHKGSACARGPRGPAGPPGIEVGSRRYASINNAL